MVMELAVLQQSPELGEQSDTASEQSRDLLNEELPIALWLISRGSPGPTA